MSNDKQTKKTETEPAEPRQAYDLEAAQDTGFIGVETDSTPDENYSVSGVTSGKPTPPVHPRQA